MIRKCTVALEQFEESANATIFVGTRGGGSVVVLGRICVAGGSQNIDADRDSRHADPQSPQSAWPFLRQHSAP